MDAFMNWPVVRQPRGLEPSSCNSGGTTGCTPYITNPFSLGLQLALPYSTAAASSWSSSFSGGGDTWPWPARRIHPFSSFSRIDPARLAPISMSDLCDDYFPQPARFHPFPATGPDNYYVPAVGFNPAPFYSGNPFDDADGRGASSLAIDVVPAPWNDDDDDIEATLREQENEPKTNPSPNYLETTQDCQITQDTRATLVIWVKELTQRHDLAAGTLHRAVSYTDRFLSVEPLSDVANAVPWLRLLGAAAVFAAAKYEDQGTVHKLNATEIATSCCGGGGFAWSKGDVLGMERALLVALDHRLGRPTAHTFVEHFTARRRRYDGQGQDQEEEEEVRSRAHEFADMSLLDYGCCVEHKPSAVAAAAMFLARLSLKPSYGEMRRWNRELKEVTGYEPRKLERCVEAIHSLIPRHGNGSYDDVDLFPMFYAVAEPK